MIILDNYSQSELLIKHALRHVYLNNKTFPGFENKIVIKGALEHDAIKYNIPVKELQFHTSKTPLSSKII